MGYNLLSGCFYLHSEPHLRKTHFHTPQSSQTDAASATYIYDTFNRLTKVIDGATTAEYTYKTDGLRHSKTVDGEKTTHIWDGSNIVLEQNGTGAVIGTYIRGINLIKDNTSSFLYNAHGDVVQLTNASGAVTKNYKYDAFGVEIGLDDKDGNPFRYCGEYFDKETGTYYLRARYYSPGIGRFLAEDTHWNPSNMVYGDSPVKINERKDALGLNIYTLVPDISAIRQSSNLYVYCGGNPILYIDPSGEFFFLVTAAVGAVAGAVVGGVSAALKGENVVKGAVKGAIIGGAIGTGVGAAASLLATAGSATGITAPAGTKTVLSGLGIIGGTAAGGVSTVAVTQAANGQWHHVLSNPIMNAINNHPTLHGLFDRAGSTVKALTQAAHQGYQTWHRAIDSTMVQWIKNTPNATAGQF